MRAIVTYQNKKYTYKIVNIYEQEKTGKIAIYRDMNKTCLNTCNMYKRFKNKANNLYFRTSKCR